MIKVTDKPNPERDKPMRCKGYDWSPFEVVGMWKIYKHIPGKTPMKRKGKARFCVQRKDGSFESDHQVWKDIEEYEYLPSPSVKETK